MNTSTKQNQNNLKKVIKRVTLSVIGVYDVKGLSINDSFSEEADYFPHYYKTLGYSATLAGPFIYEI